MKCIHLFLLLLFYTTTLFGQLTLKVTAVPANTPAGDAVFVAGTFNAWNPGDNNYTLSEDNQGAYQITLDINPGTIEFKFTRGDWTTVEGGALGNTIANRSLQYTGGSQTVSLEILSWEDLENNSSNSTATENVHLVSQNFFMPQLNRNRRIWIYLPPDYDDNTKNYPVLYMHDAQNLFDVTTSFSGEWEVDESLNELFSEGDGGVIVVGIDNGGGERINELTPWPNPQYGGGQANLYIDFIVETLKPYIDQNFHTRPEREYTGIMGSSLGGLVSLYGAIEHQDVFSKAGVFSPSLWFTDDIYTFVSDTGKEADMKIYLLGSQQESASMASDLNAMYNTLLDAGFSNSEERKVITPDGQHTEWYWAREFPAAYLWLFADAGPTTGTGAGFPEIRLQLAPLPADNVIRLSSDLPLESPKVEVYNLQGTAVGTLNPGPTGEVNVSGLASGMYLFRIYSGNELQGVRKVVIAH